MSFIGKKILNTTKFYFGKYFTSEETIKSKNDKEGVIKKDKKDKKHKKEKNKKEDTNSISDNDNKLMSNIKNEIKKQNIQDANNNNKKKVSA